MEVDGIFYIAQVKQKEKAWRMHKDAWARNQTAGLGDVEPRSLDALATLNVSSMFNIVCIQIPKSASSTTCET